jgi:Predicted Zn-dependent peptidases
VYIGWLTPPVFQPGDAESDLFSVILAGGKSSRLYKTLVYDKEIAQDVSASVEETRLGSIFELEVTAKPGVKPEDLEKSIDEEMDKLRKEGPTAAEVDRARNVTETGLIRGLQRTNGVANRLNYYNQYAGTPDYFSKDVARYDAVTPADIKNTIAKVFAKDASAVVYGVPGDKKIRRSKKPRTRKIRNRRRKQDRAKAQWPMKRGAQHLRNLGRFQHSRCLWRSR